MRQKAIKSAYNCIEEMYAYCLLMVINQHTRERKQEVKTQFFLFSPLNQSTIQHFMNKCCLYSITQSINCGWDGALLLLFKICKPAHATRKQSNITVITVDIYGTKAWHAGKYGLSAMCVRFYDLIFKAVRRTLRKCVIPLRFKVCE